jgi:hypothetical protein
MVSLAETNKTLPESFSYVDGGGGSSSSSSTLTTAAAAATSCSSLHYSCTTSGNRRGFLPPRNSKLGSAKRAGLPIGNASTAAATTPYPSGVGSSSSSRRDTPTSDSRLPVHCSPIPELSHHHHHQPPHQPQHHYHNHMAMETDAATYGSLHKVRRLNRDDDVVSASGHHLNSLRLAAAEAATTTDQPYSSSLTIDTTHAAAAAAGSSHEGEDLISPTEVANFPPPMPVKKAKPSQQLGYQKYQQQHAPPPPTQGGGGGG